MVQAATEGRPPLQGNSMRIEGNRRAQIMSSKTMNGKKEHTHNNGRFDANGNMYGQGAEEGGHAKPEAGAVNLRMR